MEQSRNFLCFSAAEGIRPRQRGLRGRSAGFTLVEMLVSMAITLIMLFAIVQIFKVMGDGVNSGRSVIEMSGQLRQAAHLLQQDLDGATAPALPWTRADSALGYTEFTEGPEVDVFGAVYPRVVRVADWTPSGSERPWDTDDVICLTTRTKGEPFVAIVGGQRIETDVAEVVWFTHFDPTNPFHDRNGDGVRNYAPDPANPNAPPDTVTLYRKVFPILPAGTGGGRGFLLDELTLRQNRVAHNTATFPYPLNATQLIGMIATGDRLGEDVVLANVISFDVRVYDPLVPEKDGGKNTPLAPGDLGYAGAGVRRQGAYVNLGQTIVTAGQFSGVPHALSGLTIPTWDTWPYFYEQDGLDQNGDTVIDSGINGLDDDNQYGVDDPGERETSPPYPHPLRGVQIRIRVVDSDTKVKQIEAQVGGSKVYIGAAQDSRQATVIADFVPG
jgi:prepilin-type N-terminal cleavage/methylation domain-containing protein